VRASVSMICPHRRWILPRQEPQPATHGPPADQFNRRLGRRLLGLEVMLIDSVTPGDGYGPGERTRTRR